MSKQSPLNIGRTTERNRRRQDRHKANVVLRASLHAQKASARNAEDADRIQRAISAISKQA